MMIFTPIEFLAGRRRTGAPLTESEIAFLKDEIRAVEADENAFVFNDPNRPHTEYDYALGKVFVARDVYPDTDRVPDGPGDCLSPRGCLAWLYHGSRDMSGPGDWMERVTSALGVALTVSGLSQFDRAVLIQMAGEIAEREGMTFELCDPMREILYGHGEYRPVANYFVAFRKKE